MAILDLVHVTKTYQDVTALDDLSLQVAPGEILGLIGHNGAGKSTTLRLMAGLIEPTSGEIRVLGQDMARHGTALKKQIGYLPEESPLYEDMTAREYLAFFAELYGIPRREVQPRINELLGSLKLSEKDKLTSEFSKGMRRKVAIARTLLHDPQLLILDEPNSGLDPLTSFFLIHYFKTLQERGKTIVLSAHNLFHVEYVCDRVAILKNGRLVVCDRMDSIRKSLGTREYRVVFKADCDLPYEQADGSYVLTTSEISQIAALLGQISDKNWALVDLSVQESALEEIYVRLMRDD